MITRHFGSVAATQIRGYKPDNLPVILIISRSRATNEVVDVIRGNNSNSLSLYSRLGSSVGCAVRLETRRSRVQPPLRSATFFRGD